ncbi:hypothetical protein K1719_005348 [Acacia pycnantha]|nr:hypothetical protein K1719_005348 [Acacia pycnantha]
MAWSSKLRTCICMSFFFLFLFLFFFFSISLAARPIKTQHKEINEGESCEGVGGEECLMRRTLAAHLDYIYTQKHKP